MADVTLTLKADNTQYVNKLKEAQQASQKLYDSHEKGMKREKGLIEDIEQSLAVLQERRKKAFTIEDIEKYNKKIAEAKLSLQEYEKAGLEVEKRSETMTQSIGKWVAGLGIAATVLKKVGDAFKDTIQGMTLFNEVGAAVNQVLYNIVNGVGQWNKGVGEAIVLAKQMTELQIKDSMEKIKANKYMREYNRLYTEANEIAGTSEERTKKLLQAKENFIKGINIEIASTKEQLILADKQWKNAPNSTKAMQNVMRLANELSGLIEQSDQGVRRLTRTIANETEKQAEDLIKWHKDLHDGLMKLVDDYLKEQQEAREKEIQQEVRDEVEGNNHFMKLRDERIKSDAEKRKKNIEDAKKDDSGLWATLIHNTLVNGKVIEDLSKEAEKRITDNVNEEEDKKKRARQESWNLIIENERAIFSLISANLQNNLNKELSALDQKTKGELAAAGNNEKLKQQILDKSEAKKAEIEKKYKREQQKIDIKQAIADGILAVIKTYAEFGWPWGIIPAGLMATLAALQVSAIKAQTFAKGGWTGKGGMRDRTGERVAGIVHEEEFVVRRGPAHRYREILEAINKDNKTLIINRLNKIVPNSKNTTNIIVENEGPNKRLDTLVAEQRKLNKRLSSLEMVHDTGEEMIIRKGNTTRTIKR